MGVSKKCQTACKPGSVAAILARDDHSSGMPVTGHLVQPTRTASGESCARVYLLRYGRAVRFLFGLAPGGVSPAVCVTATAVRSSRTSAPFPATHSMHHRF